MRSAAKAALSLARRQHRRFPPPWRAEKMPAGYVVRDANGQAIAYLYGRENAAEARRIRLMIRSVSTVIGGVAAESGHHRLRDDDEHGDGAGRQDEGGGGERNRLLFHQNPPCARNASVCLLVIEPAGWFKGRDRRERAQRPLPRAIVHEARRIAINIARLPELLGKGERD
jgi:hypothetical protein